MSETEKRLNGRIVNKHDVEENWLKAVNFVPMKGEIIVYDPDDTHDVSRIKVGDGETLVSELPFTQTKADWNENDTESLAYIENKPFFLEENKEYVLLDVSNPNTYIFLDELIGYDSFICVVNGIEEQTTVQRSETGISSISSASIYSYVTRFGNGQPLVLYFSKSEQASSITHFKLLAYKDELKQLDEKFIPSTIARTDAVTEEINEAVSNLEFAYFDEESTDTEGTAPTLDADTLGGLPASSYLTTEQGDSRYVKAVLGEVEINETISISKLNDMLTLGGVGVLPVTSYDQVLMPDGTRWNGELGKSYIAGEGIAISDDGVISLSLANGDEVSY